MSATSPQEPHFLSIAQAAALIEARQLSPVELTQAFLARIATLDPQLNAYITVTADLALHQARAAEEEIMAGGYRGPLHGIPYGLKDIWCTQGIRTTCHSRTRMDYVPGFDATTHAKLKQEGAVLLGKLATHEFAHGGPSFDLPWPPARNPWNRAHFTGGSSSGSGAAVAAGLAMAALGSDTGGSIRNPAALCGIVGLKPTYGLVSRYGVFTNSFSYDHAGPMAWTVEDAAILLQAIAGHDTNDPASASRDIPDYRAALTGDIRGLRIGILRHLYEEDVPTPSVVKEALERAYAVLRGLGAQVEDARIRSAHDYHNVKITTAESELLAVHAPIMRQRLGDFGADFNGRVLGALLISSADYVAAARERRRMMSEMAPLYEKYDVLLTAGPGPAAPFGAWRTIHFWQRSSLTTPFNVTGGPALSLPIGFSPEGLPLCMQVVGRPLADATVLRVAHAYEQAAGDRARRPALDPNAAFATDLPLVPPPEPATIPQARRDEIAAICRRAGMPVNEAQFEQLCATAPYVEEMVGHLRGSPEFHEEPATIFSFPQGA